jgi:penicillin amidase
VTNVIGDEAWYLRELQEQAPNKVAADLKTAIAQATADYDGSVWGDVHRLELFHPFAVIPFVGDRYRFGDVPYGGGVQTVMKSGHNPSDDNYRPTHGATARFLSDLSDLDSNWAVLVSGQDGWFNSASFLDQLPLFVDGEYIQLPLRMEVVRERAYRTMVLHP